MPFASISYLNGPAVSMWVRSTNPLYSVTPLSARTFAYGGQGNKVC